MATATSVTLPDREVLGEVDRAVVSGQNELEALEYQLSTVREHTMELHAGDVDESIVIDDAYVGMLYRFCIDMDVELRQMRNHMEKIRDHLHQLDLDGRDIAKARAL